MSDKSGNFHRLATKRVETIVDAIRIFGNLNSPNYRWTPDEVLIYTGQIETALQEALARFQDTKIWRTYSPSLPLVQTDDVEESVSLQVYKDRKLPITEILKEADSPEARAEMIIMQRAVIERLQSRLDEKREGVA